MTPLPLLKIDALRRDFLVGGRVVRAVDGVSLEVPAGAALGVVGESGCGKSTLARCAVRLLEPTSGHVSFDGTDLGTLTREELRRRRREFQIIFQDPFGSLDPRMPVRRILLEPFEAHRIASGPEREARLPSLLREVGLEPTLLERYPADLSGGEQQRVAIARALALQPRLLIADEPVSALDASVQALVLNLLDDIRRRLGVTLILISHDLAAVRYACERIIVMYLGRVVEERKAEELFRDPLHPYSRLLLDSLPGRRAGLPPPAPVPDGPAPPPAGCLFRPRCPRALPICSSAPPPLQARGDGDKVACFLYT